MSYLIASRSPPGQDPNLLSFLEFGITSTTLGSLLEALLQPWDHFWSTLAAFFDKKRGLGRQRCHQKRQSGIFQYKVTHLDTNWEQFSEDFLFFR